MKRFLPICLVILLIAAVWISGCTLREPVTAAPDKPSATPTPSPEPTPVPTPTPSPIPYDLVAENAEARYMWLNDTDAVFSALSELRENASKPDEREDPVSIAAVSFSDSAESGDIMDLDGNRLFILSDKDLLIAEISGENSRLLSRTRIGVNWSGSDDGQGVKGSEKTPIELFCLGDRLAVVYDWFGYDTPGGEVRYTEYVAVDVFDVSDLTAPVLLASFGQDGALQRAGVSGGSLYLVTEFVPFEESDRENIRGYVPSVYSGGSPAPLEAQKICFAQDGGFPGCSVLGIYALEQPHVVDVCALLGVSADVSIADGTVYFHSSRYTNSLSRILESDGVTVTETAEIACTDLFRFDFDADGIALALTSTVNGVCPGSGCLDVFEGSLRCLCTLEQRRYTASGGAEPILSETETGTVLYLLDRDLNADEKIVLSGGPGEIQWAGFLGDRVILSPTDTAGSLLIRLDTQTREPEQLSSLISGDAIHLWGEGGLTAFRQDGAGKLILTVYDDSLVPLDERTFGSDHSNTLENIHGYFSDAERNLIAFSADDSYCIYGISEENEIIHRTDVYLDDWAWNARSFLLGNYFYIADKNEILVFSPEDISRIAVIRL